MTDREDVTLEVVNSNGEVMPYQKFREGTSGNRYQYALVPGETYSYVATSAAYYHLADRFTMEDVADSTIRVSVPTEDWLTALAFGRSSAASDKGNLQMDSAFTKNDHSYQVRYEDTEHIPYVWVTGVSGVKIQAIYRQNDGFSLYHGNEKTLSLTSGKTTGEKLNRFLMDENPVENTLTIRLTKEEDGITYYQDYQVAFFRDLTLGNIRATCDGMPITLIQENREAKFDPLVKVYFLTVSMAARELELSVERYDSNRCYGEEQVGYKVAVDGADITEASTARIQLDGTIQTQTVTVTVSNEKAPSGTAEYVLHIQKSPPVETNFTVAPADALLAVYETLSGQRLWPNENGVFLFCEGYQYRYALTAYGYVSKSGVLSVQRDAQGALVVTDGTDTYPVAETAQGGGAVQIQWMLPKAQQNADLQPDMDAAWPNFRGNGENNAVVDAKIPTAADQGTLYWANQIGSGYGSDAVGSPILVDGDLITYAGNTIYRVDTVSGEVIKTGTMDHKSANATTSPSYAEGMVFVALTDGTVQAFNAETLESLWVYKDPLGGQPVCPLTIHNGYLYTGFWNNETGDANFVCLSITDEDAAQPQESKCASWYYTAKGGYYWAGAYASDDFVLVGCDDGTHTCTAQSSRLLAFDPKTGVLLDSEDGLNGDIRSTVVYDKSTDAYYFTSKGGSFYGFKMQQTADGWEIRDMWSVALENGTAATAMSTSSPVVYNGRAYVGVSGAGQMEAYSGHNITVIDISKKAIAYKANTQGYPQTSGLLTTAYEAQSGYVYIYFFDNMTPGKLRVLRDKAGQTKADYLTEENGVSMAYELFTPTGDHAQYAICSPITDEYGTIYYKNDTAYLMAFGSRVEKIEVTKKPDKMTYADGEVFDPAGMVVTATYANGMTRDVTRYVTFSPETISEDAVQITITYPFSMYHNEENGTGMDSGIPTATPVTTLTVTVAEKPEILGDVNADGKIDIRDANLVVSFRSGNVTLTQLQQKLADVDRDGKVDILDANRIIAYRFGEIQSF